MEAPKVYSLSPAEQALLANYNMAALNAKGAIYNLQVELEQARAALAAAKSHFEGALQLIANQHEMDGATLSPDLTRLTKGLK